MSIIWDFWLFQPLLSSKQVLKLLLMCGLVFVIYTYLFATPPYGDPNQPYDRLPGTWKTYHVKWLKPLSEGRLKVLFIIPFSSSREVVELAQRLDLDYTVIMNAGRSSWARGGGGGGGAAPTTLMGVEADAVLEEIASQRLNLLFRYDVIVIGKVSWEVIPKKYRTLILKHVERGTGLTYVSPNRLKHVTDGDKEYAKEHGLKTNENELYNKLFRIDENPEVAKMITKALPFDLIPLKRLNTPQEFASLKKIQLYLNGTHKQVPVCITTSHNGKGRVLALQYFDIDLNVRLKNPTRLTPDVEYSQTMYDYFYALLARCVRWSSGYDPILIASIAVNAPENDLKATSDASVDTLRYEIKTPQCVIDRKDLPQSKIMFTISIIDGETQDLQLNYQIRDMEQHIVLRERVNLHVGENSPVTKTISIPMFVRGNYLVDLRICDSEQKVIDFISKSIRVESVLQVKTVNTEKDRYLPGDTIKGKVGFSIPLNDSQQAEIRVRDTWKRIVFKVPVILNFNRFGGDFQLQVEQPLAAIWDILCFITDADGDIDSAGSWVGIPKIGHDNFILNMTFSDGPDTGRWKGAMAGERLRRFGVNSWLSPILYQVGVPGERFERSNLRNLYYADHIGQTGNHEARNGPWDKEFSESCMSELSRIYRYTADTGNLPDNKTFPYKFDSGGWILDADHIRKQIKRKFIPSGKFSSPLYILTGESYLSGEMGAKENSCFSPLCTSRFQQWCKKEYSNDLKSLNTEWNTDFAYWDQVRGILMMDAVKKDQLPRWVDFRYFMRSKVWTQFFIDYTDMIRRFVPGARTGRIGHMQYDYSLFRKHMTSSKIYQAQDSNPELHTMVEPELLTSFSNDNSIMIGSSGLINWNPQYKSKTTRTRFPWKMLFMGFRGYDMERNLTGSRLGGESWMTPCMSDRMPFFQEMSDQVMFLQKGIASLMFTAKPYRSKIAIVWSPRNHFISRLDPFQENGFTGSWLYNVEVEFGAPHDCLALMKSIRIRGKIVAPEDLIDGVLEKEKYRALFLPYSKGMSLKEADAIRTFVEKGGLLIADNTPGTYTEHGRRLEEPRLSDLFPVMDEKHVISCGKGHAAYLNGEMNGYMARMEKGDYTGSDAIALLLEECAGITTPVELIHEDGAPRRDTIMPVYKKGTAMYFGLLRHELSKDDTSTLVSFGKKYHAWNVRKQSYLGFVDRIMINLDHQPRFYALFPINPSQMEIFPESQTINQGKRLTVTGKVLFGSKVSATIKLGQVVNFRVYEPGGEELEWFRDNIVFEGADFQFILPISYSEKPGIYSIVVEHTVTGMKARTAFKVKK